MADRDQDANDELVDDETLDEPIASAVGDTTAQLVTADLVPLRPSDELVTGPRPRLEAASDPALLLRSSPVPWAADLDDPAPAVPGDPVYALRSCLARMRAAPADREVRRQLRAAASDRETLEVLAALLGDEASAAEHPATTAAFLEELADVLEDLDRPLDVIAALERLVDVVPDELQHRDRLARLYHRERAWLKAAAAFEEVAARAGDARARAALRAAAQLYRTHGRPERAIELYRVIGERFPADLEARAALDELLVAELPRPAISAWPPSAASRRASTAGSALPKPSSGDVPAAASPGERAAALRREARALRDAGNWSGAARVLEEACACAPDDAELARERDVARAAVLTQRAAADARAGDLASAERRLRAVLAVQPHDADAHLAFVRLLEDRGERERAAAHLADVLDELPDLFTPEARARLLHRLALFAAERGAADDAHIALIDAHRLDRRNLLITLALGESWFARQSWREAAILFGSLAAHPDARSHAAAVASALVRAAVADERNGERYLTAAVALDPGCAAAWRSLAERAKARGDLRAAIEHFEREAAATSDPAERARLRDAATAFAREELPALVAAEQAPGDLVAWARVCGSPGDARALFELARALGAELSAADAQVLASQPPRALPVDQPYSATLDEAERRALIDEAADAPLAELLTTLGEVAALVCPTAPNALFESEFGDAEKLSVKTYRAAAAVHAAISKALRGPVALLYTTAAREAPPASILLASPPVIVLGPQLATTRASRTELRAEPDAELRFHLGRAVELARVHRCFAGGVPRERFARLVDGLRWAVQHDAGVTPGVTSGTIEAPPTSEARRLRHAIPDPVRRRIAEQLAALDGAPIDPSAYHAACQRAADRSGLLACGDAAIAIRLAGGPAAARHLVKLAASPRFLAARRALWPRRA